MLYRHNCSHCKRETVFTQCCSTHRKAARIIVCIQMKLLLSCFRTVSPEIVIWITWIGTSNLRSIFVCFAFLHIRDAMALTWSSVTVNIGAVWLWRCVLFARMWLCVFDFILYRWLRSTLPFRTLFLCLICVDIEAARTSARHMSVFFFVCIHVYFCLASSHVSVWVCFYLPNDLDCCSDAREHYYRVLTSYFVYTYLILSFGTYARKWATLMVFFSSFLLLLILFLIVIGFLFCRFIFCFMYIRV